MGCRRQIGRSALAITAAVVLAACSSNSAAPEPAPSAGGLPSAGSSTPGRTGPTSTGATGEWSTGLDSRPTQAVAGDEVAFVSTSGGSKFPPQLYSIDLATGEVVQRRSAAGQPYDLLVTPDGRLWVAGVRHSDQPVGGGVNVYDPTMLAAAAHLDIDDVTLSLAMVGDEVWVGSQEAIVVVDAETLAIVRRMPLAGSVNQLVSVPGADQVAAVLVTDGRSAVAVLDETGTELRRLEIPADGSILVAATASALWVRVPVVTDSVVRRYDLPGLVATDTGVTTDSAGGGLVATDDGAVVVVDDRRDLLTCLPTEGSAPTSQPAPELQGVLARMPDGGALFATAAGIAARPTPCPAQDAP